MKPTSHLLVRHNNKSLYMIITSMLLCGCMSNAGSTKNNEMEVIKYNIAITSSREANINSMGEPVPLKINIFNLRSGSEFMNSEFFILHNKPTEVLGNNLLGHEQLFLLPGSELINISGEVSGGYDYVGISGEFQNLNNKTWRIIVPILHPAPQPFYKFWHSTPEQQEINVIINQQGLSVAKGSDEKK